jgi:hypothetical protein
MLDKKWEASVSSACAMMALARAALIALVLSLVPITVASLAPPWGFIKLIAR